MSDAYGPATLAISTGIGLFQNFLPSFTEISSHSPNDVAFAKDVHLGEIAATAVLIGVGITTASLTGTHVPFAVALGTACLLIIMYETALNRTPVSEVI